MPPSGGFFVAMPKFSSTSSERLASCHRDLQLIFNEVIQYQDCSIFCGHREEVEQNKAFDAGLSEKRYPDSKHNRLPSMAVDAGPYFIELGNTDWDDMLAFAQFAGRVKQCAEYLFSRGLITHRIRWGGDWDSDGRTRDHKFLDAPHFELY